MPATDRRTQPRDLRPWHDLRRLIDRMITSVDSGAFLDECLDTLVELLGADRGLILLGDGAGAAAYPINARGSGRALSAYEREEISRTIVREAGQHGRCILWEPGISPGTESMMSLGIVVALAAPLRPVSLDAAPEATDRQYTVGVLYVDFRDPDTTVGEGERELVETAANLISIVLAQRQKLALTEEDLRAALARAATVAAPDLAELLRPASIAPLRAEIETAVHSELPVLILGESGTGKTLLARAIAEASGKTPLVRAVLGHSDDLNTIASELFGHEKGAFSGALTRRTGLVEFADGGTLILDEILNLPLQAQQLLLDLVQFGAYRPLGHALPEPRRARVRIMAATNGDLAAAVRDGRLREDLYYRLSGITLTLPPLRARRDDIPSLAESFLHRLDPGRPWSLTVEARRQLLAPQHTWPGNIRQLEAVVQRARDRTLTRDRDAVAIDAQHLGLDATTSPHAAAATEAEGAAGWRALQEERARLEERERDLLAHILDRHGGVVARAAQELGMARTSLVSRLQTLKLR